MTQLELNTDALSDILQTVQNLPSGGSSAEIKSGLFNTGTGKIRPYYHFAFGQGTIDDVGISVQHNLGRIPVFIIVIADLNGPINVGDTTICGFAFRTENGWEQKGFQSSDVYTPDHVQIFNSTLDVTTSKYDLTSSDWGCITNVTETEMFIMPGGQDGNAAFQDNLGYTWIVIG